MISRFGPGQDLTGLPFFEQKINSGPTEMAVVPVTKIIVLFFRLNNYICNLATIYSSRIVSLLPFW